MNYPPLQDVSWIIQYRPALFPTCSSTATSSSCKNTRHRANLAAIMSNPVAWNMELHLFHLVDTLPIYSIPSVSFSRHLSHKTYLDWALFPMRMASRTLIGIRAFRVCAPRTIWISSPFTKIYYGEFCNLSVLGKYIVSLTPSISWFRCLQIHRLRNPKQSYVRAQTNRHSRPGDT